jgi:hypothetical protein
MLLFITTLMAVVSVLVCVLWWSCIVDHKNLRKAFRTLEKRCGDTHRSVVSLSQQKREWNDATFEALEEANEAIADCVTREQYKIFLESCMAERDDWIFRLRCMMYVINTKMHADTDGQLTLDCLMDSNSYVDRGIWTKCIEEEYSSQGEKDYTPEDADDTYDEDSPCHGRLGKDDDEPLSPAPFYKD